MKTVKSSETIKVRVLSSALWSTISKLVGQSITLGSTLILARLLQKEDFGLMAMALTYTGLVDNFVDFGFLSAIIQAKEISSKLLNSCFWFLMVSVLVVCGASVLGASHIAHLFAEPRLKTMIAVMAMSLVFIPSQIICRGIFSRDMRIDTMALIELVAGVMRALITVVFAYRGAGVWSLVYGYFAEKVMLSVAFPIMAKWRPRLEYDSDGVRGILLFGANVSVSSLLWYLFNKSDVFIVGRLLGAGTLGIYSIALQVATSIYQFIYVAWNRIAYPLFSRYQQSDQLIPVFYKTSALLSFFAFPACIGLAAIAPDVVTVLFGEQWAAATVPIQFISVVTAIRSISSLLPSLLNSIGHPNENVKVNFYSFILFSGMFYLSATWHGLNGVLWAWVILYPIRHMVLLSIACKLTQLSFLEYVRWHLGSTVSTVIMFFTVVFVSSMGADWNIYVRLSVCIACGAAVYTVLQAFISKKLMDVLLGLIQNKSPILSPEVSSNG